MAKKMSRVFSALMMVLLLLTFSTSVVYAATYGIYNQTYYWNQGENAKKELKEYTFNSGTNVYFEVRVTTTSEGYFIVTLQKKGLFGFSDVGSRSLPQNSKLTTSVRTGNLESGQWSRTGWAGVGSGTYKIVLQRGNIAGKVNLKECYLYSDN
ncbi:hypothetical protein J6X90_04060 [Candidatus Saccharibacteria bacterium]|nr:hypothetical protein [Candidatus Saccharibacteria bacterium]